MAEQLAEHFTIVQKHTELEDNSTDNICYLEYICTPEQPFIFQICTIEVNLTSMKVSML